MPQDILNGWQFSATIICALCAISCIGLYTRLVLANRMEIPATYLHSSYAPQAPIIAIFFIVSMVAMLAAPVHILVNIIYRIQGEGFRQAWSFISDAGTSRIFGTLATLIGLPLFLHRFFLWVVSGGQRGFLPSLPPIPEISGLPSGAETLRVQSEQVDLLRLPDIGYSCFGACLLAQWAGVYFGYHASFAIDALEVSTLVSTGLALLGYGIVFLIDDYAILSRTYLLLEKRLPGNVAIWRLKCTLGLCAAAVTLSFLMNIWLGVTVLVLIFPGCYWVYLWIDELKRPALSFTNFCVDNPGFARVVLSHVTASIVELAVDEAERERAQNAKTVLETIASAAVSRARKQRKDSESITEPPEN